MTLLLCKPHFITFRLRISQKERKKDRKTETIVTIHFDFLTLTYVTVTVTLSLAQSLSHTLAHYFHISLTSTASLCQLLTHSRLFGYPTIEVSNILSVTALAQRPNWNKSANRVHELWQGVLYFLIQTARQTIKYDSIYVRKKSTTFPLAYFHETQKFWAALRSDLLYGISW